MPFSASMNGTALAAALEVDRRTVTNWLNEDPPCPSTGTGRDREFRLSDVVRWLEERAVRRARAGWERERPPADDEVKAARDAQTVAESKLVQLDLAEREGALVTVEHLEEVVGEIGDRVRAVLINLPSNYLLHLERVGVPPEKGQAVLEEIAEALTVAIRATGDELEADADADDDLAA